MGEELRITSAQAKRLAHQAAKESGQSIDGAVEAALEAYLVDLMRERARRPDAVRDREAAFYTLIAGSRSRWPEASLSLDHGDLLYDEHGLPR